MEKVGLYGTVGLVAAAVYAGILLLLIQWISISVPNPIGFLAASFAGYAGQTLCTPLAGAPTRSESERLRPATPFILGPWVHPMLCTVVFVFTPTILNALIWSRAAQFSAQQLNQLSSPPLQNADDLGLGTGVDHAIFDLVESSRLYEASPLVNQGITIC